MRTAPPTRRAAGPARRAAARPGISTAWKAVRGAKRMGGGDEPAGARAGRSGGCTPAAPPLPPTRRAAPPARATPRGRQRGERRERGPGRPRPHVCALARVRRRQRLRKRASSPRSASGRAAGRTAQWTAAGRAARGPAYAWAHSKRAWGRRCARLRPQPRPPAGAASPLLAQGPPAHVSTGRGARAGGSLARHRGPAARSGTNHRPNRICRPAPAIAAHPQRHSKLRLTDRGAHSRRVATRSTPRCSRWRPAPTARARRQRRRAAPPPHARRMAARAARRASPRPPPSSTPTRAPAARSPSEQRGCLRGLHARPANALAARPRAAPPAARPQRARRAARAVARAGSARRLHTPPPAPYKHAGGTWRSSKSRMWSSSRSTCARGTTRGPSTSSSTPLGRCPCSTTAASREAGVAGGLVCGERMAGAGRRPAVVVGPRTRAPRQPGPPSLHPATDPPLRPACASVFESGAILLYLASKYEKVRVSCRVPGAANTPTGHSRQRAAAAPEPAARHPPCQTAPCPPANRARSSTRQPWARRHSGACLPTARCATHSSAARAASARSCST
jgi:hypothetical protein